MKKYSGVYTYKYGEHKNTFRYNYENHELEYIYKPKDKKYFIEMLEEDIKNSKIEWMKRDAERSLESIKESGYVVIDSVPCSVGLWKEDKNLCMDRMSEDIACECGFF